jgi:hypothetical protein
VASLLERWASLGVGIAGAPTNPFEDPEELISETLERYEEEGRLLGAMATWLQAFGHLLITKKLKFRSERGRRLFSGLIEMTGTKEKKLRKMVQPSFKGKPESVYREMAEAQKKWAAMAPEPHLLRHGFVARDVPLIRPKILLSAAGVYQRSVLLRYRAHAGASLRSDLLAILRRQRRDISLRELARKIHVAPAGVHGVLKDLIRSELVAVVQTSGRNGRVRWNAGGRALW